MRNLILCLSLFTLVGLFSGCATTYIKATDTQNPPPERPLNAFASYELEPLEMNEAYEGQEANEKAFNKIQEHLNAKVQPILANWDTSNPGEQPKLLVQPYIKDIKFVNGTSRFWAGAWAGSSAVVMTVKLVDASTGEVIAEPEFYQRAAAMGGAWSFGATDNNMLERIVGIFADYLNANYSQTVGGPTGKPVEEEK